MKYSFNKFAKLGFAFSLVASISDAAPEPWSQNLPENRVDVHVDWENPEQVVGRLTGSDYRQKALTEIVSATDKFCADGMVALYTNISQQLKAVQQKNIGSYESYSQATDLTDGFKRKTIAVRRSEMVSSETDSQIYTHVEDFKDTKREFVMRWQEPGINRWTFMTDEVNALRFCQNVIVESVIRDHSGFSRGFKTIAMPIPGSQSETFIQLDLQIELRALSDELKQLSEMMKAKKLAGQDGIADLIRQVDAFRN